MKVGIKMAVEKRRISVGKARKDGRGKKTKEDQDNDFGDYTTEENISGKRSFHWLISTCKHRMISLKVLANYPILLLCYRCNFL